MIVVVAIDMPYICLSATPAKRIGKGILETDERLGGSKRVHPTAMTEASGRLSDFLVYGTAMRKSNAQFARSCRGS